MFVVCIMVRGNPRSISIYWTKMYQLLFYWSKRQFSRNSVLWLVLFLVFLWRSPWRSSVNCQLFGKDRVWKALKWFYRVLSCFTGVVVCESNDISASVIKERFNILECLFSTPFSHKIISFSLPWKSFSCKVWK